MSEQILKYSLSLLPLVLIVTLPVLLSVLRQFWVCDFAAASVAVRKAKAAERKAGEK